MVHIVGHGWSVYRKFFEGATTKLLSVEVQLGFQLGGNTTSALKIHAEVLCQGTVDFNLVRLQKLAQ